jgi:peptidoglycan/xylan/chitin deacetylase (PgdA/CDA1 family)
LLSAPLENEQFFFCDEAFDRIVFHDALPVGGATLVPAAAQPVLNTHWDGNVLPAVDDQKLVTSTLVLLGRCGHEREWKPVIPLLPRGARVAVVTSWDDGREEDVPAAEMMRRYGIEGTFFVNEFSWARERALELEALGFEVASHSVTHPFAWLTSPAQWREECMQMRLSLETKLRHPVVTFGYPYGYREAYDARGDYVLRGVREAGYWSGRSTDVGPERVDGYVEPLALKTDGHFLQPLAKLDEAWDAAWSVPGGVLYFWGHAWENRTPEEWKRFEELLSHFAGRPQTWYANQGQLFVWRWMREHVTFEGNAGAPGEFLVRHPWIDPYLAKQCPFMIEVPGGVTHMRWRGREIGVEGGRVELELFSGK